MKRLRWRRKPQKTSAEANLSRYFAALREPDAKDSFEAVKHWLARRSERPEPRRAFSPMHQMKTFLSTHRTRFALASVVLAAVFISCSTPVEHEETVGYMVSGVIEAAHAQKASEQMRALDWMQSRQLDLGLVRPDRSLELHEDDASAVNHRFVIALPESGETRARTWAEELRTIEGVTAVALEPLQVVSEAPLYKVVLHALWSDNANMTFEANEERVAHAMSQYLEVLEMYGVTVQHVLDENGHRVLTLIPPEEIETSGLSTMKQFINELHSQKVVISTPEEQKIGLADKIRELRVRMSQLGEGPEREKIEAYLGQLEQKMESIRLEGETEVEL